MRSAGGPNGRYRNPVLHADWSDYLVASSFQRVPGLPVLHSRDLVTWSIVGHALPRLDEAVAIGVDVTPDGLCRFPIGPPFAATAGHWVGATLGLFATGAGGAAEFTALGIT